MAASLQALASGLPATGQPLSALAAACGKTPGIACQLVWDLSHSTHAAGFTRVYLAGPVRLALRIALVVVLALLLRSAALRLIGRFTARAAISRDQSDRTHAVFGERRSQRGTALASILGNAASVTIFTVAALIILGYMGLNLAPVLASAGVLGIALGFGAQNLVQDFLAGIFILLEDQYGVGDVIEVSSVSGTVEAVSLRITRLRDVNGVVWHVRNGTIQQAGNETHGWARAVVDVPVPYGVPVAAARTALERAAVRMSQEPRWQAAILERPEVWGVETFSPGSVLVRVAARTAPLARPEVARELRERLMDALDAEQASAAALAIVVPRQPRGPAGEPAPPASEPAQAAGEPAQAASEPAQAASEPAQAASEPPAGTTPADR
jgi:moderate conductance mechanosensitive channel